MERRESLRRLFQDLGCKVESDAVLDKCECPFKIFHDFQLSKVIPTNSFRLEHSSESRNFVENFI